jgi:hypothetical protein
MEVRFNRGSAQPASSEGKTQVDWLWTKQGAERRPPFARASQEHWVAFFPDIFPVSRESVRRVLPLIPDKWDRSCGEERLCPQTGAPAAARLRRETRARAETPPKAGYSRRFPELCRRARTSWRRGCRFRPNFNLSQPVSSNNRNVGGAAIRQPETSQAIPRHSAHARTSCGLARGLERVVQFDGGSRCSWVGADQIEKQADGKVRREG